MHTLITESGAALLWSLFCVPIAFIFVMRYPLSRIRIIATSDEVYLHGTDPRAMRCVLVGGILLSPLLFQLVSFAAGCLGVAFTFLATLGCQVELWVTARGSRVTRQFFGCLSWSVWHSNRAAALDVDDWNDLIVPDGLRIRFELGSLEIAWLASKSGERAFNLAHSFSEAVQSLSTPPYPLPRSSLSA